MPLVLKIKNLCASKGIKLEELSVHFNWGKYSIYRWDDHAPSIDKVLKVADYFGVSLDYLLDRQTAPVSPESIELAEEIKKLPPDKRKIIDTVIEVSRAESEDAAAAGK